MRLLESGIVEEISLDHDLGDDARDTGYDVILWIEEVVALHDSVYQGQPTGWSLTAENDRGRSNDCA
nr:cyclic-phosphate processing receiver domain-containing protein [Paraburkholderia sp. CNPSo 3272]